MAFMPMVVRTPSVRATRSLIAIGMPASGRESPGWIASASASARSSHSVTNAFSSPFRRSIACSEVSTSSRAETSPSRTECGELGDRPEHQVVAHKPLPPRGPGTRLSDHSLPSWNNRRACPPRTPTLARRDPDRDGDAVRRQRRGRRERRPRPDAPSRRPRLRRRRAGRHDRRVRRPSTTRRSCACSRRACRRAGRARDGGRRHRLERHRALRSPHARGGRHSAWTRCWS